MNDPEAESKNAPPLENRPAVTEPEQKRNGCARGCLGGAITYLVLGGLFTWLILSIYSPSGGDFHSSWVKRGDWLDWAMPFPFLYLLTLPIVGLGVLIAFIVIALLSKQE
jgi:hypothetical protein